MIITFSKSVDSVVKIAEIGMCTMISGTPGAGKSQLCMQLAVNALIPLADGGVGGSTLYISTEGTPDTNRISSMLQKLQNHVNRVRTEKNKSKDLWDDPNLLNKLGIATPLDIPSLMECLNSLPKLVADHGYKLIILDSIAAPIRCLEDNNERMRATLEITSLLSKLASKMNVAVVCTNHLTTPFHMTTPFNSDDQELIPALGLNISSQFDVHVDIEKVRTACGRSGRGGKRQLVASSI